jgi:integrase
MPLANRDLKAPAQAESDDRKPKARKPDKLDPRRVRIKGQLFWQIDLGSEVRDGRRFRLRRTFAQRSQAETFARLKKIERENRGTQSISMPELLRAQALEAARLLEPYEGTSLLDVVHEYIWRRELVTKSETVKNALDSFLAAKRGDNLRPRYLEDLRYRLGRFSETFGERKVAAIAPAEVDAWLRDLGQSPVSRNTHHLRLNTFFEYCRQRGWVHTNRIKDVSRAKVTPGTIGILSVEQTARLLETAGVDTLPYWAIGVFCGLRSAELERLEWSDVHFGEGLLEVPSLKSKTASRRFIPIRPALAAWLEPYRGRMGKLCPPGLYDRLVADRRRAGITDWPPNALRHSFGSYHLAHFRSAAEIALELGHSNASITFRHYRELVRPAEAERFWRIVPAVHGESIAVVA